MMSSLVTKRWTPTKEGSLLHQCWTKYVNEGGDFDLISSPSYQLEFHTPLPTAWHPHTSWTQREQSRVSADTDTVTGIISVCLDVVFREILHVTTTFLLSFSDIVNDLWMTDVPQATAHVQFIWHWRTLLCSGKVICKHGIFFLYVQTKLKGRWRKRSEWRRLKWFECLQAVAFSPIGGDEFRLLRAAVMI